MPPQLAWCQHFHYKLRLSGLDVGCKNFCPGLKTDARYQSMQMICFCKHMHMFFKKEKEYLELDSLMLSQNMGIML